MESKIGDLCETQEEIIYEWKIKDFSSLSKEINVCYHCPTFYFSGASWDISLYPNGETDDKSEGWLGLYLLRRSTGSAITLNYSFTIKSVDGKSYFQVTDTDVFDEKHKGWGNKKIILRSELIEKKSELLPSDTLTVVCSVKNSKRNGTTGSLFNRYRKLINNLEEIYERGKRTDCILKVDGQNIAAHRMILEARSPVFAAMFAHDTKENQTGEICINDIENSTIDYILKYMYSGDINRLSSENVLSVYGAAEKYDIQDIKDMCSEYIHRKLSVDWVCDVIKFAEFYQNEEISRRARDYFRENARKILKTEKWKTFAKENHDISVELLGSVVVALLPE